MKNIYDYISEYGNQEFVKINSLDAMIFARLSYINIEKIWSKIPCKIIDLNNYIDDIKPSFRDKKLIELLSKQKRFKNLIIENCHNVFNKKEVIQFFAMTINLPNNEAFVAFRGTDKSFTGLMEDLEMSYKVIPSQVCAQLYISSLKQYRRLYLGGHSKGGNLAMYAFLNSKFSKRLQIKRVYNFDGPGFLEILNNNDRKIVNYYPNCSFVGRLFTSVGKVNVIKANKDGIEGHNIYNWEIDGNQLKMGIFNDDSNNFAVASKRLLSKIKIEKRKIIIDYLYELIEKKKINIKEFSIEQIKELMKELPVISKEEKDEILIFVKSFVKVFFPKIIKNDNIYK